MSGIAGIFRRDGGAVGAFEVEDMLRSIQHRGPDRSGVWCDGPIGLGNCLLCTTPESLAEYLPAKHHSAPLVIAADARIDNREELREVLRLNAGDAPSDSDLILEAYLRWGDQCAAHLIGDFSFVIWDAHRETCFCAKDNAGVRSFYYYVTPHLFVFASEIKALQRVPGVPAVLNETRVGDHLINLYEDRAITFYKDISRLPPASTLTVTPHTFRVHTYWRLDPQREIRMNSDADYAEAFKERFDEAVRCRARAVNGLGAALSGGLDSSAIACTAQKVIAEPLHTFSLVFPEAPSQDRGSIDESSYIDLVLASGKFTPHYIRGDQLSPLGDVDSVHRHLDEANFAPNLYLHWAMYGAARENKVRVFLDGLDGDTTVSHGFEKLEEMARSFQFPRLRQEARLLALNLFGGDSTANRVLWNYCVKEMAPAWMFRAWRLMRGHFREVRTNSTLVNPDFTRKLNLRHRAKVLAPARNYRTARGYHHNALSFALYPLALEAADKASAAFGVEARYPFFDRRLIEFCLALPADQKLGQGWNRWIFRRAMEGVLPQQIQWRRTKGNLSSNFSRRLLEFDGAQLERLVSNAGTARQFLDSAALRRALNQYRAAPHALGGKHSIQLFTAANLALWLEQSNIGRPTHA